MFNLLKNRFFTHGIILVSMISCNDISTKSEESNEDNQQQKITSSQDQNVSVFRTTRKEMGSFYEEFDSKFSTINSLNIISTRYNKSQYYPYGYNFYQIYFSDAKQNETGDFASFINFGDSYFNNMKMEFQAYFNWKNLYGFETEINFDNNQNLKFENSNITENGSVSFKLNKPVRMLNESIQPDSILTDGLTLEFDNELTDYYFRIMLLSYDTGGGAVELSENGDGFSLTPNITEDSNVLAIIAKYSSVNKITISASDISYLLGNGKNKIMMVCGIAMETQKEKVEYKLKSDQTIYTLPIYHMVQIGKIFVL